MNTPEILRAKWASIEGVKFANEHTIRKRNNASNPSEYKKYISATKVAELLLVNQKRLHDFVKSEGKITCDGVVAYPEEDVFACARYKTISECVRNVPCGMIDFSEAMKLTGMKKTTLWRLVNSKSLKRISHLREDGKITYLYYKQDIINLTK